MTADPYQRIESELIKQLYQNMPIGIFATLFNAAILAFIFWDQQSHSHLLIWLLLITMIAFIRIGLYLSFRSQKQADTVHPKWKQWHNLSLGLIGIAWGSTSILIFPEHSLVHQAFIAFILCGMVAGAVAAFSSVLSAFTIFSLPALLPLLIRFMMVGDQIHYAMAAMTLLFFSLTYLTARNFNRAHHELVRIKERFAEKVRQKTTELHQINQQLQKEIQKKLESEEALRLERDKLEAITGDLGAGLAVISTDYQTIWANKVLKQHFGATEGQGSHQLNKIEQQIDYTCGAKEIFTYQQDKLVTQQKAQDVHGRDIWYEIITTPLKDMHGKITGALAMVIPINERKKREKEKLNLQSRLLEAQKADAIATLAGGMAHQLNNALSGIMGNISLIEIKTNNNDAIQKYLLHIKNASQRMSELTSQLLAYARGGKYQAKIITINKLVEETITLTKHTIHPTIRMVNQLSSEVQHVRVDVTQFQMVIAAILANAAEAIEEKGQIVIRSINYSRRHAENLPPDFDIKLPYICLIIDDNGKGMPPETLERVFDPFFTTKSYGRGLGMAAAYGIIRNHGGLIAIDSNSIEGTRVQVYLPAVKSPRAAVCAPLRSSAPPQYTILLVDDEEMVLNVNRSMLQKLGHTVLSASSGQEALEVSQGHSGEIDIALLDLILPDMNGRQLFSIMKGKHPHLKILICSGLTDANISKELLDAGVDGFIQKPFSMHTLEAAISRLKASPQGG